MSITLQTPLVVQESDVKALLPQLDVLAAMRRLFQSLAAGNAVQPPQQLVEFPNGQGDFINYLGVMSEEKVYGIKTSPYIKTDGKPLVTAWSMLMSMETGTPLLLADAGLLTTLRTAAAVVGKDLDLFAGRPVHERRTTGVDSGHRSTHCAVRTAIESRLQCRRGDAVHVVAETRSADGNSRTANAHHLNQHQCVSRA
jgi:L-arginine dehydrogenase